MLRKKKRSIKKDFYNVYMTIFSQTSDITNLARISHELRKDVLEMLHLAGSGHIG